MEEFRYDTQLLIEGTDLDEDAINDYFRGHFKGDCLLAVGDEDLIKIQRAVAGAGVLRHARRDLRHCD